MFTPLNLHLLINISYEMKINIPSVDFIMDYSPRLSNLQICVLVKFIMRTVGIRVLNKQQLFEKVLFLVKSTSQYLKIC